MQTEKRRVKVIVCGAAGKMGEKITSVILTTAGVELAGRVEHPKHPSIKEKGGNIVGSLSDVIENGDVVISFATPDASIEHLKIAAKNKKGVVIGTTGFSEKQKKDIEKISKSTPVVFAPNMSIGVNVMWQIVEEAAKALKDYNISISETHHIHKKDAPSGTAIKIAEVIGKAIGGDPKKIPIESKREGEVVGDHTTIFSALEESLEITHHALSRDAFARGAVRAAQWVARKKPGLYSMHNVLSLK